MTRRNEIYNKLTCFILNYIIYYKEKKEDEDMLYFSSILCINKINIFLFFPTNQIKSLNILVFIIVKHQYYLFMKSKINLISN